MVATNNRILGPRRNGYSTDQRTTEFCKDKVTRGLRALQRLPEGSTVELDKVQDVIEAFHFLDNVIDYIPEVNCWCVVKKYADPTWKDAVWIGCTNQEQAETMRPAIFEHYRNQSHGMTYRDTFEVEFRPCSILQILRPEVTVEEYLQTLR